MIVIASSNGLPGFAEAIAVLRGGGSAVDAVEAGIRLVEDNPEDHTVGLGGYPNLLGAVELDASIMDGRTLEAGAVGALRGYRHPISVARKVMETLPHVLLVAHGAERFAAEMGFEKTELLTRESRDAWERRLRAKMPEEAFRGLEAREDLWRWVGLAADPERVKGTVNFIVQDSRGDIGSGVSTSGWAWKYPGRLGDSPLIGAGNYADNRYGAAACTGMGEMSIRAGTARSVVLYMSTGVCLAEAGLRAMEDLRHLGGPYASDLSLLALDRGGRHAGFSNAEGRKYLYMTQEMGEPGEARCAVVAMEKRWGSA